MDGLLLLNKPSGITSFDCIRVLKRIVAQMRSTNPDLRVPKIGHAGTLDPAAEGLMLMLFGTFTKQAATFSKLDKVYRAEITLGFTSTTGDREGELTPVKSPSAGQWTKVESLTIEAINSTLDSFVGQIEQTPSIYSAIKIGGQEAYKLARRGQTPEMPTRIVTIHSINLNQYTYPKVDITAHVSSGTYIRSLAEDIGTALKTGAYLSSLTREQVGEFKLNAATNLGEVTADNLERLLIRLDK